MSANIKKEKLFTIKKVQLEVFVCVDVNVGEYATRIKWRKVFHRAMNLGTLLCFVIGVMVL